jgi:hypothetical protein
MVIIVNELKFNLFNMIRSKIKIVSFRLGLPPRLRSAEASVGGNAT